MRIPFGCVALLVSQALPAVQLAAGTFASGSNQSRGIMFLSIVVSPFSGNRIPSNDV
jgi:hypothetical protein